MTTAQVDRFNGLTGTRGVKDPCRAVSTGNLTLSGEQTVNGIACVADDRVLVKDQTNAVENGIYDVKTTAWARSADFNGTKDIAVGTTVVAQGNYYSVAAAGTIGSGTVTFNAGVAPGGAADVHAATEKTPLVNADEIGFWDSVSGLLRKITYSNVKVSLKAYFDTVYAALAGSASQVFSAAAATAAAHVTRWDTPDMASLTVTQGTGALTFAGVAHPLTFRSATLTSGAVSAIIADPADLVLPSGGTLGFVTTVQGRIIVAEMDNGGTSEYAICNIAGGLQVDETNLISTTAIGTGSDSANVWYSITARTSLPYKIVGAVDVVNTAGAWGDPVLVQPAGGNALNAMGSLGYGQTWRAVTRVAGTTYYNTTGKPIYAVGVSGVVTAGSNAMSLSVNGFTVDKLDINTTSVYCAVSGLVPPGGSYVFNSTYSLSAANELR